MSFRNPHTKINWQSRGQNFQCALKWFTLRLNFKSQNKILELMFLAEGPCWDAIAKTIDSCRTSRQKLFLADFRQKYPKPGTNL